MELGFKNFFQRRRSKSKPLLISAPLADTFRQTGGYDEFAAGPAPTIGTRPIKPSEQNVKRKSFSHIKTKSVGIREFRHLVHIDSNVRPRTAPGTKPPDIDLPDLSNHRQQNRISLDETPMRCKSLHAPPNVPNLPKGLAEMGGAKYFDLLQAAVSTSKAKAPPVSTRTSFDYYNESIADRNSLYGKLPISAVDKDAAIASSTHRGKNASQTQALDAQRASFAVMRASRSAMVLGNGAGRDGSPVVGLKDDPARPHSKDTTRRDISGSEWNSTRNIVSPLTPSESRRSKRRSVRQTDLPAQLSPIPQEKSGPTMPPAAPPPPVNSSNLLSGRRRSKTVPTAPTLDVAPDQGQTESPAVLTLQPFEDGLGRSSAAESTLVSSGAFNLTNDHIGSASTDQVLATEPSNIASGYLPPRMSSDRSTRKRKKHKRHSRDRSNTSTSVRAEKMHNVKSPSRRKVTLPRRVMGLTANGPGKRSDEEDDNDYDIGIEEAVTHHADPVHILRASVISANGYAYKGGDNVVLGKVLHHRPSRRLSQMETTETSPTVKDLNLDTRSSGRDGTPASAEAPSPTSTTTRLLQSSHSPAAANASLQVPEREPAEARTSLPKSEDFRKSPSSENNLHYMQSKTIQPRSSASTTNQTPPTSSPIVTSPAAIQHYADLPPISGNESSMPPSPGIVTRDFAHPKTPPRVYPAETVGRSQSVMTKDIATPIERNHENGSPGSYIHIRQEELERHSSDLDRSIAIKKEAAAKALLKLQQVMAMPTWDAPPNTGRPRGTTKIPKHWRDLSIEDGSPIAPSAIFKKVKIPVMPPPFSRHSTFSGQRQRDVGQSPESVMDGAAEGAPAPSLHHAVTNAPLSDAENVDAIVCAASLESPERRWLEHRGRSDTAVPEAKGSHSRMGSAVSANSGTSVYSLPYHMVPARGSSMRDSQSSIGDFGGSPRFHAGELGWP